LPSRMHATWDGFTVSSRCLLAGEIHRLLQTGRMQIGQRPVVNRCECTARTRRARRLARGVCRHGFSRRIERQAPPSGRRVATPHDVAAGQIRGRSRHPRPRRAGLALLAGWSVQPLRPGAGPVHGHLDNLREAPLTASADFGSGESPWRSYETVGPERRLFMASPSRRQMRPCDETIPVGRPCVWVAGIDHRSPAHNECLSPERALPDGDGSNEASTAMISRL
jgi:hypothetical protein